MMRRDVPLLQRIDWIAIGLVVVLALLGWVNVISATAGAEEVRLFDLATSHGKQLLFIGVCTLLAIAILNVEGEFFIRTALINYAINLVLLLLVLAVGKKVGGALAALVAFAIVSAFFGPVKYGMIAELVDSKELARANGIINMATNVAVIAGGIVAGVVVTHWKRSYVDGSPTGLAAWMPGIAMGVAVVLGFLTCLTLPKLRPQNPTLPVNLNPFSTYISTMREMAKSPLLAVCGAWTFFYFVASVVLLILPDYSSFLGVADDETAYLKAGLGVAIGIGCVLAAYLDTPTRRGRFVPLGAGGLALSFVLLGLAPADYWITMALLALTGLVAGFYIIPLQSMLQALAPDESRGRVLGTANGLSFVMGLLGGVVFFGLRGPLHLPSNRVFLVVGALCAGMAVVSWKWLRGRQAAAQRSERTA